MLVLQDSLNKRLEPRQIVFAGVPNYLGIHSKVLMNQKIPHISHSPPEHIGMLCAKLIAQIVRRFTYYLKLSYNSIYYHFAGRESPVGDTLKILADTFDGLSDMRQIRPVISHKRTLPGQEPHL